MEDAWSRIEEQFRLIPKAVDEDVDEDFVEEEVSGLDFLAPGASEEEIADFEAFVGRPLPDDFRRSLARHNGTHSLAAPYGPKAEDFDVLLNIESMKNYLGSLRSLLNGGDFEGLVPDPEGPVGPVWWSMGWIPFVSESTGNHMCIDLDPPADGTFGQVFDYDHERGPTRVLFPDFGSYLEYWAKGLESGAIRFTGQLGEYEEWSRGINPDDDSRPSS